MVYLLWRRGSLLRLAMGVLALALAGGAVLGTQLAGGALARQAAAAARAAAGKAQYDLRPFDSQGFTAAALARVRRLHLVLAASPLVEKADLAELPGGGFRQVVLIGVEHRQVAMRPVPVLHGRLPRAGRQVAVSQDLAAGQALSGGGIVSSRVGRGARLRLVRSSGESYFRVSGVVSAASAGAPFTADAVYLPQAELRRLFSSGLQLADIALRVRPHTSRAALVPALDRALGSDYTLSDPRLQAGVDPISQLQPLLDSITALSLVLALAITASSLTSLVLDRRWELGLLRLAGATPGTVYLGVLRESLLAAVFGGAAGVGVGYGLAAVLLHLTNPAGAQVAPLTPNLSWSLTAFGLVVATGAAASLVPAALAARVGPLEAARQPRPSHRGRWWFWWPAAGAVAAVLAVAAFWHGGAWGVGVGACLVYAAVCSGLAWVGPKTVGFVATRIAPVVGAPPAAVAARTQAQPTRVALAAGALFVTLATAAGLLGLSSAALQSGGNWVDSLFPGNYLLVSPVAQSSRVETQLIRSLRHSSATLEAYAPVRFLAGRVGQTAVSLAATQFSAYRRTGALQFLGGNRRSALNAAVSGSGVLVPRQVASSLGVRVGSKLRIFTADGSRRFRVAAILAHTLPGSSGQESLMLSATAARRAFGRAAAGFNLMQVDLGGSSAGASARASGFHFGLQAESVTSIRRGVDSGVANDVAALTAMALVGVLVAVVAAVNTMALGAREGARELGLLRVVGLSAGEARRTVVAEAAALAATGCCLGVVAGIALTFPEVNAASTAALPLSFSAPLAWVALIAAGALAAVVLCAIIPARRLSKLNPVAALAAE